MSDLARTYNAKGRYGEAEELEVTNRVYGEEHPKTLTSMVNLASTYHDQGRYELAEELEKKVVRERNSVFGAKHPETLSSMRKLLATYEAMGERRENEHKVLADQIAELETSAT
ncbi:kinesin light chain [Ceratobasidium sp. AG-Ba]|nr:kinesin light chain [Ceratobasidium sp. AG-Ba]